MTSNSADDALAHVFESILGASKSFAYRCDNDEAVTMTYLAGSVQDITGCRPAQLLRNRDLSLEDARGPERIAPEWWLADPAWRSGVRDYWRVTVTSGETLWLYYAHGADLSAGWFCHGVFI